MALRTVLISVSDKTGIVEFARGLAAQGARLLSTGGTFTQLEAAGVPVQSVESYTESPEVMGGRVKTLHPRVHGGILAREGQDNQDLTRISADFIDMVVVNLYPFEATLTREDASFQDLIENIDIGGPSMLRSAAKNHSRVAVLCDPADYSTALGELNSSGEISAASRQRFAAKAFAHTAAYDSAISGWLSGQALPGEAESEAQAYPQYLTLPFERGYGLRYGENPHQSGAFYRERTEAPGSISYAESLGSGAKELSFNNLVDADAAWEAVQEFGAPAAVVIKHASPCGASTASTLKDAYFAAREADPMSAFGGIVALNREVDLATAELLAETFLECIIAPRFQADALERLRQKSALRLLATDPNGKASTHRPTALQKLTYKRISGGIVVMEKDLGGAAEVREGQVVTKRAPSEAELAALEFAWATCKHVKSNAIVLAGSAPGAAGSFVTVGIGGGQTARVTAVQVACEKAAKLAQGAVLASDAFFPFPDGLEAAIAAGITAAVQPGGSKKDPEVIAAADRANIAMIFTNKRHFRH